MGASKGSRPTPRNLFSFSRVKTYRQCRPKYRYRYLKGMSEAFRSVEGYLGSTVHDVLEWLYRERDQGRIPTPTQTLERFEGRWHEGWTDQVAVVRIADTIEAYLLLGRQMLQRFHVETLQRDRSTTVGLEQRLSVAVGPGLHFTGIADRIGRTHRGRLFVVDYKTSSWLGDGSELSEGLQAPLYAACVLQHEQDDHALAGYHYLRHGTTNWHRVGRGRAGQLFERFRQLVEQARTAQEFPPNPGVLCAWCGFNHLCPQAQVPAELGGGLNLVREQQEQVLAAPGSGRPEPETEPGGPCGTTGS